VHDRQPEPFLGRARCDAEIVPADVGVIQAQQLDIEAIERHVSANVRQLLPTVGGQGADERGGTPSTGSSPLPTLPEVREVVQRLRDEVVDGAEYEPRRQAPAYRPNPFDGRFDRLRLRQEVPGHDRDIRRRQRREEPRLPGIVTHEMQVGEVQDDEGPRGGRR
jgi:hypothetical protein